MNTELLAIRPMAAKGLGVVLRHPVTTDAILDVSPVFELDQADVPLIEGTAFRHHYFAHPEKDGHGVVVLGVLTLLNHAAEPNCRLDWRHDPATGWSVVTHAKRDLPAGTELTIDYNCELWFEVR